VRPLFAITIAALLAVACSRKDLARIAAARENLRAGKGVRMEGLSR